MSTAAPPLARGLRPARMPRAIFCDMDGTVLNEGNDIAPGTVAALRRYKAAGGVVVFTTGRNLKSLIASCETAAFWADILIASAGTTVLRPEAAVPNPLIDPWLPRGTTKTFFVPAQQTAELLSVFLSEIEGSEAWCDIPGKCAIASDVAQVQGVLNAFKDNFSDSYPVEPGLPTVSCALQ